MERRFKSCFLAGLVFLLALGIHPALAEVECLSQVKYHWEYTVPEVPQESDKKSKKKSEVVPKKENYEVSYVTRRLRAATKEQGAQKLKAALDLDVAGAMNECRSVHENLSGCTSAKFLAMSNVLRQLDFNARKELELSISEDCRRSTGRCLKAEHTEIECTEIATGEATSDAEGEEKEAGAKKKK